MMGKVGNLQVGLTIDTSEFKDELADVSAAIEAFELAVQRLNDGKISVKTADADEG